MRKLVVLLGILFLTSNAYAGIISYTTLSSDAGVSYNHFNDSFNDIYNEFNGSIDSLNLANGAVLSEDIGTAVSPLVRDQENIGEYVFTGLLPATDATLTSNISAGTAYITNDGDSTLHRVVKDATSKTYTASKDTYVYLSFTGAYQYDEQVLGASQPTTPDNHIILAKVVTDGNNITSVSDLRQTTPPNLRVYEDLKIGLLISRDSADTDLITIGRGEIDFGTSVTSGKRRNINTVNVNFATTGRGGLDTGSQTANTYYYIHAVADDDNESNYEGIASLSSTDATGVTGERLVGWCYADTTGIISPDSVGAYRGRGGDAPNIVYASTANIKSAITSTIGDLAPTIRIFTSDRPIEINYTIMGNTGGPAGQFVGVISVDGVGFPTSESSTPTDSFKQSTSGVLRVSPGEGTHSVNLRGYAQTNDLTFYGYSITVEEK